MKKKYRQLIMFGVVGIIFFFLLSLIFPALMIVSKIGALLVYAAVSATQILMMRNNGENVEKSILFTVVVILAVGYLLFFVG
ncbi:hypothetical protein [[Eubacterium] hominis]|uniref:hypothetical protein n=1 Tax=[Eubacterium] hominis TaxID=2764325 RepID=UPI003A4DBC98